MENLPDCPERGGFRRYRKRAAATVTVCKSVLGLLTSLSGELTEYAAQPDCGRPRGSDMSPLIKP
jgi:hypothetical protein